MISQPWSIVLTAVFAFVGLYCLREWLRGYAGGASISDRPQLVHLNHAVMSVLMIVMIWRPADQRGAWVQAIVFVAFGAAQVALLRTTRDRTAHVDLVSHILMNAAMVWMLLAMPLLMGGAAGGGGGGHHGGGGDSGTPMEMMPTPAWAGAVNVVAIGVCVAICVWWLLRLRRPHGSPVHLLCHALGAVGMALMLALM